MNRRTKDQEKNFKRNVMASSISSGKFFWKLQKGKEIHIGEHGQVTKFVGTEAQASTWAARFPGWNLVPA